jgi:uracil-DNA glycosylase
MGFCYPGAGRSGDLPPRPECAPLWHEQVLQLLPSERLTLLVGTYSQARYLGGGARRSVTENVREQPRMSEGFLALPHPSWRSSMWMRRNSWFDRETLPKVRQEVQRWL